MQGQIINYFWWSWSLDSAKTYFISMHDRLITQQEPRAADADEIENLKSHIMNPINFAHTGSSALHLPHQMAYAKRKVICERITTSE